MSGITLTEVDVPVIARASMQVTSSGGIAVNYERDNAQPVWWAAEEAGVNDMVFEKYPLKAHDPRTDEVVEVPKDMQDYYALLQHYKDKQTGKETTTPIGIHKKDVWTHPQVIATMREVFGENSTTRVDSLLVSGPKMIINIPLPLIDIKGDETRSNVVIINDMSAGKMMALIWNTVVRCTNEIPAMMIHGGSNRFIFGTNRGNGVADARKGLLKSRDIIIHGQKHLQNAYNHFANMQLSAKDVDSIIYRIFPDPRFPKALLMQTQEERNKKRISWQNKRHEARRMREGIMEVFEGNSNTMSGNEAINNFTYYRLMQSVSEVASKYGNMNDHERVLTQFIGNGKRNQPVATAMEIGIERLNRDGIFFSKDSAKRKKIRSKIHLN